MIDPNEVYDLQLERAAARRGTACQCDGAHLRACPGPENCPFSGIDDDDDEGEYGDD